MFSAPKAKRQVHEREDPGLSLAREVSEAMPAERVRLERKLRDQNKN